MKKRVFELKRNPKGFKELKNTQGKATVHGNDSSFGTEQGRE